MKDEDLDPAAAAIFARLAGTYRAILDGFAGPDVRTALHWPLVVGRTPVAIPAFNRVMASDPAAVPPTTIIDAALDELDDMPAYSWWLPPGPARALAPILAARGFRDDDGPGEPAMWVDTAGLGALERPAGVEIDRVRSAEESDVATATAVTGFELPHRFAGPMADMFRGAAARTASPIRMFLARLDGRPVATSIGVLDGDMVGIYNVATVPEARGRGIGRAITLATLLDARARGARIGLLESSAMGRSVYRRLGFAEAGTFRVLIRMTGT
ncbi:MAG TPA: GNAT family N-acetyltransferase [Candidatus Sulfomarinibacteraceae bacterium]|nr:GNAT family N-acetyltransferase [Candidatus Sulfomarinibacteraceae bacterium]